MKIAVVYNRESQKVINLFGVASREKYGLKAIQRIVAALKGGGHQVIALEGDKDLIANLERFMPKALAGERPGMVFNLSYGIQGQARYTHVPGILEMVGVPYVGSGPLAHSLALDKVVAKMIFVQNGVPTPEFAVLEDPAAPIPPLSYPAIVKPRNEAVSFGIKIVHNEDELREAAGVIFERYGRSVLVERYIEGREINVGLLGNGDPEVLPPAELDFGDKGERIYTEADKKQKSGRTVSVVCPAPLTEEETERAKALARRAFSVLGILDCARVDMRMDAEGNFYVLEINSLPSMGEHGSYTQAAAAAGLTFEALCNRLVDVASARYFGGPSPTEQTGGKDKGGVLEHITARRDRLESRVQSWVDLSRRTNDHVGIRQAQRTLDKRLEEAGLRPVPSATDSRSAWLWESDGGYRGGTLLVVPLDVPLPVDAAAQPFVRDPESMFGEGVASSAAALAIVEFALRALPSRRKRKLRIGVLAYADEGDDCRSSAASIERLSRDAARVIVMRPGGQDDAIFTRRRGHRQYRFRVDGTPRRLGQAPGKRADPLQWFCRKVGDLSALTNRKGRIAVAITDVRTRANAMLLPHRVDATLAVTHPDRRRAEEVEEAIHECLRDGASRAQWSLEVTTDRPAMVGSKDSDALANRLATLAQEHEIPCRIDTSSWPSVAGLVPTGVPVVCGLGPSAHDLNTPRESVSRASVVQRTVLLARALEELDAS